MAGQAQKAGGGALAGIKVIDLSRVLGGPFATQLLGDHGADVISCSWGPADGRWFNPADPTHNQNFPLPASTRPRYSDCAEDPST